MNALHLCIMKSNLKMCQLILGLVASPSYFMNLYRNDTFEQAVVRSQHCLDLYLNLQADWVSKSKSFQQFFEFFCF
jgi:hypothetical protein